MGGTRRSKRRRETSRIGGTRTPARIERQSDSQIDRALQAAQLYDLSNPLSFSSQQSSVSEFVLGVDVRRLLRQKDGTVTGTFARIDKATISSLITIQLAAA
jgi:hypothetical protein